MPHNIVIIEDNQILAFKVKRLLEQEGYHITAVYSSGEEFIASMGTVTFDLAIVDIMLKGELTGIDVAKQLRALMPQKSLIFISGLSDDETLNMIKEVNPDCYIKKPYDNTTLLVNVKLALAKAKHSTLNASNVLDDHLIIEDSGKLFKIPIDSILFIQSDGNYVHIHSKGLNTIMLRKKLSDLEELLVNHPFIRTHNRYLINLNYAFSISKKEVYVDTHKIPISEKYQQYLKDQFLKNTF